MNKTSANKTSANFGLEIMNALLIFITMCKVASVADNRVEQSTQGVGREVLRQKIGTTCYTI